MPLTTAAAVFTHLGVTPTAAQTTEATALLGAADAAIQNYCGRNWLTGAITDELHQPDGPRLYLRQRPVASIQSVKGRKAFNATATTLVANTDYEVRDLTTGLLLLGSGALEWPPQGNPAPALSRQPWSFPYAFVTISYTPTATVPADVALAATMLVASWIGVTLSAGALAPGATIIGKKVADTEMRYSTGSGTATDGDLPSSVQALLRPYASQLVFS